jgi:phosphoglycolate phosphatase
MAARGVNLAAFSDAAKEILPGMDYSTMKPYPGLGPVLSVLEKDCLLAVVSSNSRQVIEKALNGFGLAHHFQDILGSDFLFSKQEKIGHALSQYGAAPGCTYYIGDTTGDIREAKAAGVMSVAAAWGWHSREKLAAAAPDFLIDTPRGLLDLKSRFEQGEQDMRFVVI